MIVLDVDFLYGKTTFLFPFRWLLQFRNSRAFVEHKDIPQLTRSLCLTPFNPGFVASSVDTKLLYLSFMHVYFQAIGKES